MYNAGKYIEECFNFIYNLHLFKDVLKLVVINDGSEDISSEIAQDYASKYSMQYS